MKGIQDSNGDIVDVTEALGVSRHGVVKSPERIEGCHGFSIDKGFDGRMCPARCQ